MSESGISQLPVIDSEGKSVGAVRESRLMSKALEDRDVLEQPIIDNMEESFPVVDESAGDERMSWLFSSTRPPC